MVDLNNNKRPVVAATLAGVLAIMIVGAGFMTGKFEAIKPVDKPVNSVPVISKMVSSVSKSAIINLSWILLSVLLRVMEMSGYSFLKSSSSAFVNFLNVNVIFGNVPTKVPTKFAF